jgi:hypothetical protein
MKKRNGLIFIVLLITLIVIAGGIYLIQNNYLLSGSEKIIKENIVNDGDGLYLDTIATGLDEDSPFSSKYYFKGKNPNNFIVFENRCWQIINIAQNNSIKMVYYGKPSNNDCSTTTDELSEINNNVWNDTNENDWQTSTIKDQLESWVNSNNIADTISIDFTSADSKIEDANWYIGGVRFISQSLSTDIEQEKNNIISTTVQSPVYSGKLGLITASDYLKISCQMGAYDSTEVCKNNNFLVRNNSFWTLTATASGNLNAWAIKSNGLLISVETQTPGYLIYPVIYLNGDINISGKGSINNPYIVID